MKDLILAENVGQGTKASLPMRHASFAPMKMVKRRVGWVVGDVARSTMRSKSDFRRVEVYLLLVT